MRLPTIATDHPQTDLIAAVLRELYNDARGEGHVEIPAPEKHRRQEFARIRREQLQTEAVSYVDTDDFAKIANLVGLEPDEIRRRILDAASS